ncbi:hypothetical protein CULT_1040018 [[Clostridium] ultunense Esp]|nr:hypothetical protein CULT_1040018 [[Clostridium] ultunense Esp]
MFPKPPGYQETAHSNSQAFLRLPRNEALFGENETSAFERDDAVCGSQQKDVGKTSKIFDRPDLDFFL